LLVLLGSLSPAEMEPEEGVEPSTFRLRGDSEPESPNRWVRWRSSDKVAGKPGQAWARQNIGHVIGQGSNRERRGCRRNG
jgi:hypothetical protein